MSNKGLNVLNVQPLVLINIDILILFEDEFKSNPELIFHLLKLYNAETTENARIVEGLKRRSDMKRLEKYYIKLASSFSFFVFKL